MAADCLGSYGSLAKMRNVQRIIKINENIILGASGDFADFQYIQSVIEQKMYVNIIIVLYYCNIIIIFNNFIGFSIF